MTLRTRAVITTFFLTLVFGILQFVDLSQVFGVNQILVKAVALGLLFFVGVYWVLGFDIKGMRFLSILGNSSTLIFIFALFIEIVIFQNTERISQKTFSLFVLGLFTVLIYFLILTANILNVSYISQIPLARAAKASNFIYTLLGAYFSFLLILKSGIEVYFRIPIYTVVVLFLTFNVFWFKRESFRQHLGETVAVVLCMVLLHLVILLWPLSVEVSSMLFTIVFYILLGLGIEETEMRTFLMRAEYIILLIIVVLVLLKLAVWGINGSII